MTQPTAPAQEVNLFHTNSDKDSSKIAQHHTLGIDANQGSPGDHTHDGRNSKKIGGGAVVTGSRDGNAALASLLTALSDIFDIDDQTTI